MAAADAAGNDTTGVLSGGRSNHRKLQTHGCKSQSGHARPHKQRGIVRPFMQRLSHTQVAIHQVFLLSPSLEFAPFGLGRAQAAQQRAQAAGRGAEVSRGRQQHGGRWRQWQQRLGLRGELIPCW